MKTKSLSIMALLLIASMVLTACGTTAVETVVVEVGGETVVVTATPETPFVPKVMNLNWGTEPPTADPALATDTTSVDLDGQLFMGLEKEHTMLICIRIDSRRLLDSNPFREH